MCRLYPEPEQEMLADPPSPRSLFPQTGDTVAKTNPMNPSQSSSIRHAEGFRAFFYVRWDAQAQT